MTAAPELRRMVTREMIEAHYKSIMNAARLLLSQGETIHAQDLLSEACSRPYPTPAPAAITEARCVDATLPDHPEEAPTEAAYRGWTAIEKFVYDWQSGSRPDEWRTDLTEVIKEARAAVRAQASMPEATDAHPALHKQTTAETARLIADALNDIIAKARGGHTP